MNWRAMAYSSETRGYLPPVNDAERLCAKRVADQIHAVQQSGMARTTTFLNEREQMLAIAQLNRCAQQDFVFEGGYSAAERKMLCIFETELPQNAFDITPVLIAVRGNPSALTHRDYLGALMGLQIKREQIGDILPNENGATVFFTAKMACFVCDTLCEIGRFSASATQTSLPKIAPSQENALITATVSSLRLDALLAAMLKTSRGTAADIIRSKAVMINHVETTDLHSAVYAGDVFSVRGKGKYKLCEIQGKSKKDRTFVSYIQY
ncbi:MAG: YlmH/Sll1252 family protein [Ruthenibacterium sp.]